LSDSCSESDAQTQKQALHVFGFQVIHLVRVDWDLESLEQGVAELETVQNYFALLVKGELENVDAIDLLVECEGPEDHSAHSEQEVIVSTLPRLDHFRGKLDQVAVLVLEVGADTRVIVGQDGRAEGLLP